MNDSYLEILEKYQGEPLEIRRGRGAWICKYSDGVRLLKEYRGTVKRLEFEEAVLGVIQKEHGISVDQYVRNQEDELLSTASDGTKYVLKEWFLERECNLKDVHEVLQCVSQLGRLHKGLRCVKWQEDWNLDSMLPPKLEDEMERHNKEMKRVRTYISGKRKKNEFDLTVMHSFNFFFKQALEAQEGLKKLGQQELGQHHVQNQHDYNQQIQNQDPQGNIAREQFFLCHGDLDHHHMLMQGNGVAFIEFNQLHRGKQIADLYRFMRKVMEKHNWDVALGMNMIEHYNDILPMDKSDQGCLYYLFLYPEKYWKQLNYYNNANKAWIPEKNVEKLRNLEEQQMGRNLFLSRIK